MVTLSAASNAVGIAGTALGLMGGGDIRKISCVVVNNTAETLVFDSLYSFWARGRADIGTFPARIEANGGTGTFTVSAGKSAWNLWLTWYIEITTSFCYKVEGKEDQRFYLWLYNGDSKNKIVLGKGNYGNAEEWKDGTKT